VADNAFAGEHAIEVQLPFIQTHFKNPMIVPIVVGNADSGSVCDILSHFWSDKDNVFVISSDLSHFHTVDRATKIDSETYAMIESCDTENFSHERACGATAIRGLADFASRMGFAPIRIGTLNSGNFSGDKSSVVGYGAWLLAECGTNKFIKDHFSELTLAICRGSIESHFSGVGNFTIGDIPAVFQQLGAAFVTLKIGVDLRGCVGSIRAHQSLFTDLVSNARGSAFRDSRFPPLTASEFKNVKISVSLLSKPQRIAFNGERELLDAITPQVDGIIIRDGFFQSVYLPCVWEQLPNKRDFMASLKIKAGLLQNHFSDTLEAFKFSSECIG
jgi:AmmeMemoRadiSam system protein A